MNWSKLSRGRVVRQPVRNQVGGLYLARGRHCTRRTFHLWHRKTIPLACDSLESELCEVLKPLLLMGLPGCKSFSWGSTHPSRKLEFPNWVCAQLAQLPIGHRTQKHSPRFFSSEWPLLFCTEHQYFFRCEIHALTSPLETLGLTLVTLRDAGQSRSQIPRFVLALAVPVALEIDSSEAILLVFWSP